MQSTRLFRAQIGAEIFLTLSDVADSQHYFILMSGLEDISPSAMTEKSAMNRGAHAFRDRDDPHLSFKRTYNFLDKQKSLLIVGKNIHDNIGLIFFYQFNERCIVPPDDNRFDISILIEPRCEPFQGNRVIACKEYFRYCGQGPSVHQSI